MVISAVTVADVTGTVSDAGTWLKTHRGPDTVIFLIFLFSGLVLNAEQIISGLTDTKGTLITLIIIFIAAPILGALFCLFPLDIGIKIGIFLVAVMPTTLSSGVVMTGAAGGNMAHALMITILANSLSVFTIPVTLSLLLKLVGTAAEVSIDKTGIMIKLAMLVIVPLCAGLLIKFYAGSRLNRFEPKLQIINQCFILAIVWMAMSQTREAIITGKGTMVLILLIVFIFHLMLLSAAWLSVRCFDMGPGRRESILFMGGQKTLTLSIILQVSLFPQYGLALAVCVLHHIIHLMMDGYLVEKLKAGDRAQVARDRAQGTGRGNDKSDRND